MKPRAVTLIPERFEDRRQDAFAAGLAAAGFEVHRTPPGGGIRRDDALLCWNLHRRENRTLAAAFEAAGAAVLVAEEGYTRRLGAPKHFALALDGHNGSGRWFPDGPTRWQGLGIALKPWRDPTDALAAGGHVLVCAARGMGSETMAEPPGWGEEAVGRLRALTTRPLRLRKHPGKAYRERPLEEDLKGAWAVVVWASSCAVQALAAGVPVFYEAPHMIAAFAARPGLHHLEEPRCSDERRRRAFAHLAWAQWTPEEIARGDAFRHLLFQARAEGA